MFWLAQVISLIGIAINIACMQLKEKRRILFFLMITNFLFALNFALLQAYSGALICLVAGIQTFLTYTYQTKNKEFPKILIFVFLVISIVCGLLSYETNLDILPMISSVLYTLSIIQKKEKHLRVISLLNILVWIIYDFIVGAVAAGISNVFLSISTIIAIIRYDIIKQKNDIKE